MKCNFSQVLSDLKKEPLKNEDGSSLLLSDVIVNALLTLSEQDRMITGKEKAERYDLAMRIHKVTDEIEVTIEELSKIKDVIGKLYTPLLVGQAFKLLEQK